MVSIYRCEIVAPLVAFSATYIIFLILLKTGIAQRLAIERPNTRSLHRTPTPRIGGVVLVTGIAFSWLLIPHVDIAVAIPMLVLAVISYFDDRSGLPIGIRLVTHVIAAAAVVHFGLGHMEWWIATVLTVFLVWMMNLFNFMDGSDGLAGGMAVFGFTVYGIAAWFSGAESFAALNISIASSAAAFLIFNFYPAKIFLGDAGSVTLGFLAGIFGLAGWANQYWPLWFPVLVFFPFIVDATVTLGKRVLRAETVWQAHREHYYQRLVRMGWGHRKTALAEYVFMAICGLSALALHGTATDIQWASMTGLAGVTAVLMVWVDRRWRDYSDDSKKAS